MNHEFYRITQELLSEALPFVTVTLVDIQGSAPQEQGAKMIVTEHGLHAGTVGGGKVEARAIEAARNMLNKGTRHSFVSWHLQKDIGMTCGGVVHLFFELHVGARWKICIFGAGHVAQSLVRLLLTLEAQITCVDSRSEWLDKLPQNEKLKSVCVASLPDYVDTLPDDTFIVSLTMGHATDVPLLKRAFERGCFPYVGAIGSKGKARQMRREIGETLAKDLICPIGLPLGHSTPVEMAISIAAQLLQKRDE